MAEVDIEQLKKQISIRELIGRYTVIKGNKAKCPIHDDRTPSLKIYDNTNSWHCFGGCGGGDIIDFIEKVEGIDFIQAIKQLSGVEDIEFNKSYKSDTLQMDELLNMIENLKDTQKPNFNDSIIEEYAKNKHRYFLDLGFKQETLDFFKIGFCCDMSDLHDRAIIPWFDINDNLCAIVGRSIVDSKSKYKAKYGSDKQIHLYNLNNAKKYAITEGIILVEDEKSVWRLREFGFNNGVALGNSSLNGRKWLLMRNTNKVYVCMDNQEKAQKIQRKIIKELKPLVEVYDLQLGDGYKDIAEISDREVFVEFYNNVRRG